MPMTAYVISKITNVFPPTYISATTWKHIKGLNLADPDFLQSGKIDILLGVNIYARILCKGIKQGPQGSPTAQSTKLGWILFGEMNSQQNSNKESQTNNFSAFTTSQEHTLETLNNQMRKFWEWEELNPTRRFTSEEEKCERVFQETHKRLEDGRYEVRLPFKKGKNPILGDSKQMAVKRFQQLEKKMDRNAEFRHQYSKCIQEYIDMDHMSIINSTRPSMQRYYLPHHAVIKDSTTTKLRVVFDASARSSNGKSLNEQLMTGPTIQPKLYSTLLKWRKHKYAMTGDIEKMYRMIKIHDDDRRYQTILWRSTTSEPLLEYELNTVTFGTSAPYLAIKTLQQLAADDKQKYPEASEIATQDFYVDDVLTGADTIAEAIKIQADLIELLKGGGFKLRKWAANHEELLKYVPASGRELELPLKFEEDNQIKALGIQWHPTADYFTFSFKEEEFAMEANTKRKLLSQIAKLFDPLGWIAPAVILAKGLMQRLWISGCTWDEEVSAELIQEWKKFKSQLIDLRDIKIPRWLRIHKSQKECQIHGFCDASMTAYAATVYIRIVDHETHTHTQLVMSRTRVAPIKPVTIPRLELCAAVLLTRLIKEVKADMQLQNVRCFLWSDSKVVLAWIKGLPNKWRTYVANRVAEIQEDVTDVY